MYWHDAATSAHGKWEERPKLRQPELEISPWRRPVVFQQCKAKHNSNRFTCIMTLLSFHSFIYSRRRPRSATPSNSICGIHARRMNTSDSFKVRIYMNIFMFFCRPFNMLSSLQRNRINRLNRSKQAKHGNRALFAGKTYFERRSVTGKWFTSHAWRIPIKLKSNGTSISQQRIMHWTSLTFRCDSIRKPMKMGSSTFASSTKVWEMEIRNLKKGYIVKVAFYGVFIFRWDFAEHWEHQRSESENLLDQCNFE